MRTVSIRFVYFAFLLITFGNTTVKAQEVIYTQADSIIFEDYTKQLKNDQNIPFGELIVNSAKYFLNKPYVASTLEISEKEKLVINLQEFDCTTFVENCIALSAVIKSGNLSFTNYIKILKQIRYGNGIIDGYTSRLHYIRHWIFDNEKKGILKNITKELGGKNVDKIVDFMSKHPESYKQLKNNKGNVKKLEIIEDSINRLMPYTIIPKSQISTVDKEVKNGDIIAFATSINGLDYSHIGIAYSNHNDLYFIHASSRMKKVVIEPKTLTDYCNNSKNCTGVSIFRVND